MIGISKKKNKIKLEKKVQGMIYKDNSFQKILKIILRL